MPVSYTHLDVYKRQGEELLQNEKDKLYKLQEKLYADGSKSLLVVLQAMDAAGKDSLIEHVFGGVNPVSYTHLDVYKRQERFCFLLLSNY